MSIEAISWASKQQLPPRDKFVLVALCDHHNRDEGSAWMKQSTLAEWTGYSRATVNAALEALEHEHKLITSETRRYADGRNAAKIYRINFDAKARVKRVDSARVKEVDSGPARVKGLYPDSVNAVDPDSVNRVDNKNHELRTVNSEPLPPQPLHEPPIEDEAEVERGDLEDLTHYQRRQLEKPPDRLKSSQLATEFPRAWAQLANFRRLHARPVPEAQFTTWASAVLDDARQHGDALVSAALQVTNENFPNLNQPFAFYRGCIRRAAVDADRPDSSQPAGEVMSQDDVDRMFALAREGALA